jgi:hypothetical protein
MTYEMHDQALRVLQGTGPELRNGAPNHAPMVAEALAALGRDEVVHDWIEVYRSRLSEGPRTDAVIGKDWKAALGDFSRLGEWQNRFRHELAGSPWKEVLDRWLPRLIPGSMASGTHGIIRCGHAARALENDITVLRLEELANALALRYSLPHHFQPAAASWQSRLGSRHKRATVARARSRSTRSAAEDRHALERAL